jgi:hypothetical protein
MLLFADDGPECGTYLWRDTTGAGVAILADPPGAGEPGAPIGIAMPVTWDHDGAALWKLSVYKAEVPGLWRIERGRFVAARGAGHEVDAHG